jgi:HPt (histidine-containing phosphotransfer) domain-containing protein
VPIVALTAHDARTWRERVVAAGMDDILSKSYSLGDCRAMLLRWIKRVEPAAATPQPEADDLASIDTSAVRSLGRLGSGGPEALYNRLIGLYESSSQPVMAQLEAAIGSNDFTQAADLCHRLKSSSANVGAAAFAAALRELEQQCRKGEAAQALDTHRRLAAAYQPLLATLRSRRMAASA